MFNITKPKPKVINSSKVPNIPRPFDGYQVPSKTKPFIPKPNTTIAVHVVTPTLPTVTPNDILNEISDIHEIEGETISFDSQLDVVLSSGITRTMTGIEERFELQHLWLNFLGIKWLSLLKCNS